MFVSQLWVSHNSDFISRNSKKKVNFVRFKLSITRKKSQNCEIKSRNYFFIFYSVAEKGFHNLGKFQEVDSNYLWEFFNVSFSLPDKDKQICSSSTTKQNM